MRRRCSGVRRWMPISHPRHYLAERVMRGFRPLAALATGGAMKQAAWDNKAMIQQGYCVDWYDER